MRIIDRGTLKLKLKLKLNLELKLSSVAAKRPKLVVLLVVLVVHFL